MWDVSSDLDRGERFRDDTEWLKQAWGGGSAQVVRVTETADLAAERDPARLTLIPATGVWSPSDHIFLGLVEQTPLFARLEPALAADQAVPLRYLNPRLDSTWADVANTAVAIVQWHLMDPRCPRCGGATEVILAGFGRWCPTCAKQHFPRSDAAIIVAILDADDRLLLGHQTTWPAGRSSLLAGFVEAGESLEHAVYREMAEESGIPLTDVAYFGSQPWPFPRSLMVGFFARAATAQIDVDGIEIEEASWFDRDQVRRVLSQEAGGGWGDPVPTDVRLPGSGAPLSLPGPGTIAHRMIDSWLNGHVPDLKPGSPVG